MYGSRSGPDEEDRATDGSSPGGPEDRVAVVGAGAPRPAEEEGAEHGAAEPESGAVERKRESVVSRRFGVGPDETVEVVVRPGDDDFWWTWGLVTAAAWTPVFVTWLFRLGSGDPVGFGLLVTAGVLATLLGLLTGGVSAIGPARMVATDRGIRVSDEKDGPVLIPWEDVLSIEPTFPYVAEYRIEVREGSPVLEELRQPSWIQRIWTRAGKRHRLVGSEQIWDIGSWRLEVLQDALDRHAVRAFRSEVERDRGRARLPADDPGAPVVAVPGTVSGAQAPDEEPETPDDDTNRDEDER